MSHGGEGPTPSPLPRTAQEARVTPRPEAQGAACCRAKRILLVIGGGIAAYKSLDLIRRLQDRGAKVRAILTRAGSEFVTPLSVGSLTGDKVFQELFSLTARAEMGHIELSA